MTRLSSEELRYQGVFKFIPSGALPACCSTTPGLNRCNGEASAQEKVPPDNLVEAHLTLARGGSERSNHVKSLRPRYQEAPVASYPSWASENTALNRESGGVQAVSVHHHYEECHHA